MSKSKTVVQAEPPRVPSFRLDLEKAVNIGLSGLITAEWLNEYKQRQWVLGKLFDNLDAGRYSDPEDPFIYDEESGVGFTVRQVLSWGYEYTLLYVQDMQTLYPTRWVEERDYRLPVVDGKLAFECISPKEDSHYVYSTYARYWPNQYVL